jgi:hypothetical protein
MARRLIAGIAVALVVTWTIACAGKGYPTEPSTVQTTAVSVPVAAPDPSPVTAPNISVDGFVGEWQADALVGPAAIAEAEAAAPRSCNQVEFHARRDVDSRTAAVVFAGNCARVRVRVEGKGLLTGDALMWRAEGKVTLPNGNTCAARFADGNRAEPAREGLVKVTYKGTVCGNPVAGTALVRRR